MSLFTKALALELAAASCASMPSARPTSCRPCSQYQAGTYGGGDPEGYFKRLLTATRRARTRFIRPEEVAELIFYLASPAAAPITGANISIDFGTSAGYGYGLNARPPPAAAARGGVSPLGALPVLGADPHVLLAGCSAKEASRPRRPPPPSR